MPKMSSMEVVSKSTSTSMRCWSCKQPNNVHELVHVYAKSCNDRNTPRKICGFCLVGYHIPVLRPSMGKWELGTVLSYSGSCQRVDRYRHQYQLKFTDDEKEWVSVRADPFEAYARHFEDLLPLAQREYPVNEPQQETNPPAFVSPNRSLRLSRQGSFLSESGVDHSSGEDLGSSSFDSSDDLFFSTSSFHNRNLSGQRVSFVVENPPKEKTRTTFSKNLDHPSPGNRKPSNLNGNGFSSPARSHISSLSSTNSPISLASTSTSSSQRISRLWTPKEDKALLDAVAQNNNRLCWPKIALDIPDRSGKQCRERYLNHLGPHLKHSGWSALEDATIFRLYAIYGSKWSKIVKSIPGRTDNGIKNRFHHLRKRFHRRMKAIPYSKGLASLMEQMGKCHSFQKLSPDWFVTRDIATRILNEPPSHAAKKKSSVLGDGEYKFGPFDQVEKDMGCSRCGLIVPSKQTGTSVCLKTGWCETCTETSLAISGDLLRAIHLVKKAAKTHNQIAKPDDKRKRLFFDEDASFEEV